MHMDSVTCVVFFNACILAFLHLVSVFFALSFLYPFTVFRSYFLYMLMCFFLVRQCTKGASFFQTIDHSSL